MMIGWKEIQAHSTSQSCWVVVRNNVYDLTAYLPSHPGGPRAILRYAGRDATKDFESIHPPGTIEQTLSKDRWIGTVNQAMPELSSTAKTSSSVVEDLSSSSLTSSHAMTKALPLSVCVSLHDIESQARRKLSRRAYIYYSSTSEDQSSQQNDSSDWNKIRFRPRVLCNVAEVDMTRRIMGFKSALPIFIAPMALGRLAHTDGELCFVRGAARQQIPFCVSSLTSVSHEDLCESWHKLPPGRTSLFFQLYVPNEENHTRERIRKAKALGFNALVVTVDTPVIGKREIDERDKLQADHDAGVAEEAIPDVDIEDPTPRAVLRGVNSSTLSWRDLKWIREEWGNDTPIVIKGIGCAEDAKVAHSMGFKNLWLSNHGGRQIASAPSAISTLLDIRYHFPEVLADSELYIDGSIRRGSDVVKALCLGAHAVAIGRPFMYAIGAFGEDGVVKTAKILSDEIETTMRLLGVRNLNALKPECVNAVRLEQYIASNIGKTRIGRL